MHAFLLLTLVPGTAHATDLSWTCTTVTATADVVTWRGWDLGAAQAGADAFDALRARVDADCLADCSDPLGYFCPERTCVTAAGDLVTWSTDLSEEPSYYDDPSHYLTTIHIVVEPAPDAGMDWTRAEVTRRASSGTSWSVAWEGSFDPRGPVDGSFTASAERDSSLRSERWQDGTCVWVAENGYAIGGERVTMNGTVVWVSDPNEDRACGVSTAELGGARATINGVPQGLVDVVTWRPLDGTDADDADDADDDCDDADPSAYPGAPETWRDGVDQDCDGRDGVATQDWDMDGWPDEDDCAPTDAGVHPGAAEAVGADGVDSNCDGLDGPDPDGDGIVSGADCGPADASIHPGATDTPDDGIDQDCDGVDATGDTSSDTSIGTSDTPSGCGCVTVGVEVSAPLDGGGPLWGQTRRHASVTPPPASHSRACSQVPSSARGEILCCGGARSVRTRQVQA